MTGQRNIPEELHEGLKQLGVWENLPPALSAVKLPQTSRNAFSVLRDGENITIAYREKVHFFRALSLLADETVQEQEMMIPKTGIMLDLSRNRVLKPEKMKQFLRYMARMGLNQLYLYMEDTFVLPGEEKFGYLRGGYTQEELRALDTFAYHLGIELIPAVQTLGHMEKVLRHPEYAPMRDTANCLLVGSKATEDYLAKVFDFLADTFRTRTVNVCLDETHGLGLGNYLRQNGYCEAKTLFVSQLALVAGLAKERGMNIMLYSDMLFSMVSPSHRYLDPHPASAAEIKRYLPDNASLIYWDYYTADEKLLQGMMECHKLAGDTVYAGPIHSVSSFAVHYEGTFRTAIPAMRQVKRCGITQVYGCIWHDDGGECSDFLALAAMQFYAEHAYTADETVELSLIEKRLKQCTGLSLSGFLAAGKIDHVPQSNPRNRWLPNTGKILLWQDILCGLYDGSIAGMGLGKYYDGVAKAIKQEMKNAPEMEKLLRVPYNLARVLSIKAEIGLQIKADYDAKNLDGIKADIKQLTVLKKLVKKLHENHRAEWLNDCSPFGWDRLDLRYGGLLARIDTAKLRLEEYLAADGVISIPELETKRFADDRDGELLGVGIWKTYRDIATLSDG